MAGRHVALTERDRRLLAEVQRCGVLTRDHVLRLRIFGSKTRANARLLRLTAAGYLCSRVQPLVAGGPRLVYMPGRLLDGDGRRARSGASDLFLSHELGLVDIRLAFEAHSRVTRWLSAADLKAMRLDVVPDAFVEYGSDGRSYCAFVEYDRGTETLGRIERKVRSYTDLAFSGRFERAFGQRFFRALFVTDTPDRLESMTLAIARITDRVVRLALLADVSARGPLSPIWRRPGAVVSESLTEN